MTKRIILLALLIGLFVLASCNLETPNPDAYAWCYLYDFTSDDYGFSFVYGSYVEGVGFVADNQYRLVGGLINDFDVYPVTVSVTIERLLSDPPPDPVPTLNIQGVADIFGLSIDAAAGGTLPLGIDTLTLTQDHQYASDHGSIINATIQGSAPYAVTQIWVGGQGFSPFDVNPCSAQTQTPTHTPFIATDAPTSTLAPTYTPSPTSTPTPTPTGAAGYCYLYEDFDSQHISGTSITSAPPGPLTVAGETGDGRQTNGAYDNGFNADETRILLTVPLSPTWTLRTISVRFKPVWAQFHNANRGETSYRANGSGSFSVDGFNSITWNAGNVPSSGSWHTFNVTTNQANLDAARIEFKFLDNLGGAVPSITIDNIIVGYQDPAQYCSNLTPTPTPSHSPTPSSTYTGTPTITNTPINVTAIASGTPTQTRTTTPTRIPVGIYTLPPLGTLPPPLTPWATGTVNYEQTLTAIAGGTGTPQATGTYIYIPWDDSSDGDSTGEVGDLGDGIREMGRAVLGFGQNAMNQAFGYARTLGNTVSSVVTVWSNAQPTPIEGLPNCNGSARLQSELCAIYYILTYTLFSGTLGQLLIPIATIIVGMVLIFTVIKRVRATAARISEVTKT